MPPIGDEGFNQWKVMDMDIYKAGSKTDQAPWHLYILARFVPERGAAGLTPLDMTAVMDGEPVPFTFDPESQIFESRPPVPLAPGKHRFEIRPREGLSQTFPILTQDFEAP